MSEEAMRILEIALSLSASERALIVERLLASLDRPGPQPDEASNGDAGEPSSEAERRHAFMAGNPDFQVDRTAFSVVSLSEADNDVEYWRTKTPQERLQALELTRQVLYGYAGTTPRLQRVLTVAQLERR